MLEPNNRADLQWIPTDEVPSLTPQALHIWRLSLQPEPEVARLWNLLSQAEQGRAQRFVRSQDQAKFVQVRGTLRILLGQYLKMPGEALCFDYGDYGKPQLVSSGNPLALQFNVSHSHELALIAITQAIAVGIDIEQINPQSNYLKISHRFFTTTEHQVLLQQPQGKQCQTFFQLWTRKEACIKAMGGSIADALDQINVGAGLDQSMVTIPVTERSQPHQLFVQDLLFSNNYAGAVATTQPLQRYTWHWHGPRLH